MLSLNGKLSRKTAGFIPIPKKGKSKECLYYCTIAFISQASQLMLKVLQDMRQHYVNHELPDI